MINSIQLRSNIQTRSKIQAKPGSTPNFRGCNPLTKGISHPAPKVSSLDKVNDTMAEILDSKPVDFALDVLKKIAIVVPPVLALVYFLGQHVDSSQTNSTSAKTPACECRAK